MAQRTASRERVVCSQCDLPYYGDKSGCPYCQEAGLARGAADEPTAEATSGTSDTDRESLLGRLKRTLGM
ncbi:hypothetical protein HWV23_06140 [Natronomonas halophila]|uniref:hypothetical protein n=1 Tax=Natronomonas halophila TaxID=2747817 RepID=UPI0015B72495|nr:hypothetical protein [Natronomonas halophila]QLD85323.1 hypothetical protein HWV23_06140 [Natronomonas halophila]